MAAIAKPALKEIESNMLYIDDDGNLVLNTLGQTAGSIANAGNPAPTFLSTGVATRVSISAAAGAANICDVTIRMKDGAGNNVSGVFNFEVYLSDASTGAGLTTTTASGTVTAAAASGIVRSILTAKKDILVQSTSAGLFVLEITDTAKTGFYPVVSIGGKVIVGAQLITGNYG